MDRPTRRKRHDYTVETLSGASRLLHCTRPSGGQRPRTVRRAVRDRFAKASDSGIRKRLAAIMFEPPSPFDSKVPRHPRLEVVVLGSMLGATAVLVAFFNICARLGR
jgi:hypothetical protein